MCLRCVNKVIGNIPYRLCEGLLGKCAGMEQPGEMMPWDWTETIKYDEHGQGEVPGIEEYVARGPEHRPLNEDENEEWDRLTTRGDNWDGVMEFIRAHCSPLVTSMLERPEVRNEIGRRRCAGEDSFQGRSGHAA
eukprot:14801313-Alexandrium_andersonii.AAC.1